MQEITLPLYFAGYDEAVEREFPPRLESAVFGQVMNRPFEMSDTAWVQRHEDESMDFARRLFLDERGQDIAEYAVMLAVILVIVVGTVRLIGTNANNVFSSVASSIQ
jgi:Flp pilus assembly pilin Flp